MGKKIINFILILVLLVAVVGLIIEVVDAVFDHIYGEDDYESSPPIQSEHHGGISPPWWYS